ncbi:MAG: DUF3253 domain-containing protein [Phycisphaerales bacterium]
MPRSSPAPRMCVSCGRSIAWRKKWERDWDQVRYCSRACRSRGVSELDTDLQRAILSLLKQRSPSASICPSEAARAIRPEGWRQLMEPARRAARRLAAQQIVEITQAGRVIDATTARGPIRIRLPSRPAGHGWPGPPA